jgi:hypothetical protein
VAAFINYIVAGLASVTANGSVIFLSLKMKNNGEFKWVFMGLAISDLLLSLTIFTLSLNINFTEDGNLIMYSENPLIGQLGPHFCSFVFKIFFQWQTCAVFYFITLISINRYIYICLKSHMAFSERFWLYCVFAVQLITFLLIVCPLLLPNSVLTAIPAHNETFDSNLILCTYMDSSSEQQKINMNSITIVGVLSYLITIFCVVRLVVHLRKSFQAVSAFFDENSVKQQKSTLIAIVIQAFSPLLCFFPVFVVTLVEMASTSANTDQYTWYLMNLPLYVVCWSPFIDALATLCFMKDYRSRLASAICKNTQSSTTVASRVAVERRNIRLAPATSSSQQRPQ